MRIPPERHLKIWLEAESRGADTAAEGSLGALFQALPEARPSPGFAGRVLAGAGILETSLRRRFAYGLRETFVALWSSPWGVPQRAAVAFCLLVAGLTLAAAPGAVVALGRQWMADASLAELIDAAAWMFAQGTELLVSSVALFERLGGLYRAFLLVATSPPVLAAWIAALVFSALTFRFLSQVLDRSPRNVVVT